MLKLPPEVVLRPLVRRSLAKFPDLQRNKSSLQRCLASSSTPPQKRYYQAAICTELGKPLVISKVPAKELSSDDVRVKIFAAAVSFADILSVKGEYQEKMKPPFIPGTEFSGVVTEVGSDVTGLSVGMRVFGLSWQCEAYAEETVVNAEDVFEMPEKMTFSQAAGFLYCYATPILALEKKANIKRGEKVLVTAAAGAVGLATVDLAKNVYGAEVIGAAGGPAKCALLEKYGADTVDYLEENIREKVRSIHPSGVDIVFEAVGGDAFKDCFRSLAPDGRLLVIGFTSGKYPSVAANHILVKNVSVIGVYFGSYKFLDPAVYKWTVAEALRHFKAGNINPYVGATFKLDQVNEAYEYIQARKSMGKVALVMQD